MLKRIVVITLGLMVAGFVAGAAAGVLMMVCCMPFSPLRGWPFEVDMFVFAGLFGGAVGAVLGPVAAWLLMRHVPLGIAVGGTALGTVAGSAVGALLVGWPASFYGGLLGFGVSAVALRIGAARGWRALRAPGIARVSGDV